ncbi:hypothetical protein GCM10007989_04800 [Devosia pacifica]|uniref:Phage tail tape measure protein domain-containing protein n=1 Tax=Devosia pacifica TaxID=1335967 RepID=A0A918RUJ3_9HYPH|nr:phage tail tape measure protein [Devosia pacifica]GHA13258.1 hypothetical protein GCM10007989_04800 [Devosia pacifica]
MATLTSQLIVSLIDEVTAPARSIAGTVHNLQSAQRANRAEMDAMRGRMVDAAAAAYAMARAVAAPVKAAIEFESAMADIRKVVDFETPEAFKAMSDDIVAMSMRLPMAANDIAAIVAAAGQAGMAGDELLAFAEMASKVGVAFDMSGDQVGEALAKIKTQLNLTVSETGALADAINHLSNNSASAAPDLIEYMKRVASAGEFFGFTSEQTAAIGSAMIAAGAEAEVAATSFRNVGRALSRGSSATDRQAEAFQRLGLDVTEVARQFNEDAVGTLRDVIVRINGLPEHLRANTLSEIFGDEARALQPLVTQVELYDNALESVADKTAYLGSTEEEYAARAATTANNMQLLANKAHAISIAIGNALLPALNAFADAIGPVLIAIADFAAQNPAIVQAIIALVGSLVAVRVASVAARWGFLFLKGGLIDIALFATRGAASMLSLLNPINLVKGAMVALRFAVIGTGIGAILVGIALAGMWIYNNWKGLTAFFEGFGSAFMAAIEPIMPVLQPVVDAGSELLGWVEALVGPVDASEGEWRSWGETLGGTVGNAIRTVVEGIQSIMSAVGSAAAKAGELANALGSLTLPEAIQWIKDMAATGISLAIGFTQIAIPQVIQWLMDIIGSVATFGINIEWPQPPEWLTWLMGEGAKLLGMGGDAGVVGGATPAGTNPDSPEHFLSLPDGAGVDGTRAAGGPILGGKTYLVGEHGPELVTPNRSGFVHTADQTSRMMGGLGPIQFGDIVINGVQNPTAIVDEVIRQLNDRVGQAFDGIHADIEYRG